MPQLLRATSKFTPADRGPVMNRIRTKIAAAAVRGQEIVWHEARALVPVDTGELYESIVMLPVVDDGQTITALVVATAAHAAYVEYGTGLRGLSSAGAGPVSYDQSWLGMPAQPYMRPALDMARAKVLEEFRR